MIIYMDHPKHGAMVVYSESECAPHEANGWVRRPEATIAVKAPAAAPVKATPLPEPVAAPVAPPDAPEHDYTPKWGDDTPAPAHKPRLTTKRK